MYEEEKASILVVDDNPSTLHALLNYLEEQDFETLVATNGERAIRQLELFQPDLILLDVMMPGIDGFETCRRLKENENTKEIPVIFMTALTDTVDKLRGFDVGGVDYVTKPFQHEELLARIHAHLTIRKLQLELQEQSKRFQGLAEATFEGIIIHDKGRILEVNRAMVTLFGYQYPELIGKNILELVVPEYHDAVLTHISTEDGQLYEMKGIKEDGMIFILEIQTRLISYHGRDVRVSAVRDITERKQAEEKIKESMMQIERAKKEWETTANSLSYVVCLLDNQGHIIRVNRTIEHWDLGRVIDLKGQGVHELFHPECANPACYLKIFLSHAWEEVAQGRSAECEAEDNVLQRYLSIQVRPISVHTHKVRKSTSSFAVGIFNDITERKRAEDSLRQHNHDLAVLNRMSDLFQACYTEEETYSVVRNVCKELFPLDAGCLYMMNTSQPLLNMAVSWGEILSKEQIFDIDDCWDLRYNRPHLTNHSDSEHLCPHLKSSSNSDHLCVPISVPEQILGVLYLRFGQLHPGYSEKERKREILSKQMVITRVTEHYALVLVNLRLRETLRMEAIRDPLTNLYNRRYMEESLEREVRYAERHKTSIGIIMLDIDHFKNFNDSYGHEAGDLVLQELGTLFRNHTRADDIACRYGGEEFLLIMPEAPLTVVEQRAQELHAKVKDLLRIAYQEQILTITVSMGVAAFPDHGPGIKGVVNAADAALYQAKAGGRDQVVVASL